MKITPYLEQLIWKGQAEYKTRMIGGGTTWIQKIPKNNFIVVLGYQFQGTRDSGNSAAAVAPIQTITAFGAAGNFGTFQVTMQTKGKRLYNRIIQNPFDMKVLYDGTNYNAIVWARIVEEEVYLIADDYLTIQMANWIATPPTAAAQINGNNVPQVVEIDNINPGVIPTVTGIPIAGPQGLNPLGEIGVAAGVPSTTESVKELIISNAALAGKRNTANHVPMTMLVHYVQCYFPKPSTLG